MFAAAEGLGIVLSVLATFLLPYFTTYSNLGIHLPYVKSCITFNCLIANAKQTCQFTYLKTWLPETTNFPNRFDSWFKNIQKTKKKKKRKRLESC